MEGNKRKRESKENSYSRKRRENKIMLKKRIRKRREKASDRLGKWESVLLLGDTVGLLWCLVSTSRPYLSFSPSVPRFCLVYGIYIV